MDERLTHASFFSGVGGLDLGLERAGWHTVSFSEIDPYASAVLAQRWPGVPNLGDIGPLAGREQSGPVRDAGRDESDAGVQRLDAHGPLRTEGGDWRRATLWTGGFPCQDLSVAGKRRGMVEGTRSNLAYAFLELVGRYRPRFVLLENVPGLLSSHGGRDMATLLGALVELGYGVGYRILDARYFGVPQRRRRVFILGDSLGGRAGAERAAEVLSVGSRCDRHPPTGVEAGPGTASEPSGGVAGAVLAREGKGIGHNYPDDHLVGVLGAPTDTGGDGTADGLAGRLDDRGGVAWVKRRRAGEDDRYPESWGEALIGVGYHGEDLARGVGGVGGGDDIGAGKGSLALGGDVGADDPLLPVGLDSHRYRCCGNGVVADVSEWIGERLRLMLEEER